MENSIIIGEIYHELNEILKFWESNTIDKSNGGFYGRVDFNNKPEPSADKGIILNARILWTFSTAADFLKNEKYKATATYAYNYIKNHFLDKKFGGVYWSLNYKGNPVNRRKQIYAQAFAIYAFSEYYSLTGNSDALKEAVEIFGLIEKHSYDKINGGYIEAFDEQWGILNDVRLSEKDANEKKTMNTHLHVLESYTGLYRIWKDKLLQKRLHELIEVFIDKIVDKDTFHLNLFFNEEWMLGSSHVSYGHDIEASWLLYEAALVSGDEKLLKQASEISLKIARASCQGIDKDGGMMNEYHYSSNHLDSDKHWWPQAEAMVGFLNSYEISGDIFFYKHFLQSWQFIKKHIIDNVHGEWIWRVDRHGNHFREEKAGFWKCPYHNTRACIEVINRLKKIEKC